MIPKKLDIRLVLDNIRSVYNVGSIFRTADAAGVTKIYCVGTTPTPTDRFGRKRKDFAKVSLGAEGSVAWEHCGNDEMLKIIKKMKNEGVTVVSLEQDRDSTDYRKLKAGNKTLVIVGNEVKGVSKELLDTSDVIAEIPMRGQKESLNVSVACGILLFQLFG